MSRRPPSRDSGDVHVLVQDLHVAVGFNHAAGHDAGLVGAQIKRLGAFAEPRGSRGCWPCPRCPSATSRCTESRRTTCPNSGGSIRASSTCRGSWRCSRGSRIGAATCSRRRCWASPSAGSAPRGCSRSRSACFERRRSRHRRDARVRAVARGRRHVQRRRHRRARGGARQWRSACWSPSGPRGRGARRCCSASSWASRRGCAPSRCRSRRCHSGTGSRGARAGQGARAHGRGRRGDAARAAAVGPAPRAPVGAPVLHRRSRRHHGAHRREPELRGHVHARAQPDVPRSSRGAACSTSRTARSTTTPTLSRATGRASSPPTRWAWHAKRRAPVRQRALLLYWSIFRPGVLVGPRAAWFAARREPIAAAADAFGPPRAASRSRASRSRRCGGAGRARARAVPARARGDVRDLLRRAALPAARRAARVPVRRVRARRAGRARRGASRGVRGVARNWRGARARARRWRCSRSARRARGPRCSAGTTPCARATAGRPSRWHAPRGRGC